MKDTKEKNVQLQLAGLLLFLILILTPKTMQAAVTVKENGEYYMTDTRAEAAGEPLYGRFTINYTGNSSYTQAGAVQYNKYKSTDAVYQAALKALKGETSILGSSQRTAEIKNSSTADLKRRHLAADGSFKAAYLVWTTRTSANRTDAEAKALAKCPVALVLPDGSARKVTARYASYDDRCVGKESEDMNSAYRHQKTFVCMFADVTDIVNGAGYGSYGVCNIPYYADGGGGAGDGGWQLIVVENNPGVNIRAVRLKMQARFNIDDVSKHNGSWVETDIKTGIYSKCKSKAFVQGDTKPITGQYFYLFQSSNIINDVFDNEKSKFLLYAGKETINAAKSNQILKIDTGNIRAAMSNNGVSVSRDNTTLKSELMDFDRTHAAAPKAYEQKEFTLQTNTGSTADWITMFVTGFAIDIADNVAEGRQITKVNNASSVTVSQTITNASQQKNTGYYNGKLVVMLDANLTPVSKNPELTIYNNKKTVTMKGTWNAARHTVTFDSTNIQNITEGSYLSYSIDCTVQQNSGAKQFANGFVLSGDLRSQGENTDVCIDNIHSGISTAIPMYTLTVKMDKATLSKVEAKRGKSSASGKLGTINSQSAAVTDSDGKVWHTASYDITYDYYISAAPSFAVGYEFSKWTERTERTGETVDRKASSGYVNGTTCAYERQMPNSNLTLTITGVGETYEVRYYMNAPRAIADTDSWKIGGSFTLFGNGTAETDAKIYTGAQIKNISKNNAPYIYKTYRYGNYYSVPASANIKIPGYRLAVSGSPQKKGWWTAASGGNYVSADGAASGVNAGKVSAADWRGYAKSGALTNGKTGKIISLYAHWELDAYTVRFDGNGADSGSKPDMVCVYGTQYTMPENTPPKDGFVKTGYSFTGQWNTKRDGTGTAYVAGRANFKDIGNTTLYAQWKINYYDVTLTAGNGIESVSGGGRYAYNSKVDIDAAVLPGYHWKGWTGTYGLTSPAYSFTMPAQNVYLTAEADANAYTIHFDANTGREVTPIPDIATAYDRKVTLPDANGFYIRYTLDGADITQEVLDGTIVLDENGAALTAEEAAALEETAETDETAEVDKTAETDETAKVDETAETEGNQERGTAQEAADAERPESADLPEGMEAALETSREETAEPIEEIPEAAPVQQKKAYASVFMGWALENGRYTFDPQWKYGEEADISEIVNAAGLTDIDGAVITLYAVWDDCPWITAEDLYYSLEQAQSGFITEEEILSRAEAFDREDGSPILPGYHEDGTSFSIPDYQPTDFTQFEKNGSCTENLTVVDSAGSMYVKQITVHVVDMTLREVDAPGITRFINEYYYNQAYENGGLRDDSVWKADPEYRAVLEEAFSNVRNNTPEETYSFTHETVLDMKEFINENGFWNTESGDALLRFYNRFLVPNREQ